MHLDALPAPPAQPRPAQLHNRTACLSLPGIPHGWLNRERDHRHRSLPDIRLARDVLPTTPRVLADQSRLRLFRSCTNQVIGTRGGSNPSLPVLPGVLP